MTTYTTKIAKNGNTLYYDAETGKRIAKETALENERNYIKANGTIAERYDLIADKYSIGLSGQIENNGYYTAKVPCRDGGWRPADCKGWHYLEDNQAEEKLQKDCNLTVEEFRAEYARRNAEAKAEEAKVDEINAEIVISEDAFNAAVDAEIENAADNKVDARNAVENKDATEFEAYLAAANGLSVAELRQKKFNTEIRNAKRACHSVISDLENEIDNLKYDNERTNGALNDFALNFGVNCEEDSEYIKEMVNQIHANDAKIAAAQKQIDTIKAALSADEYATEEAAEVAESLNVENAEVVITDKGRVIEHSKVTVDKAVEIINRLAFTPTEFKFTNVTCSNDRKIEYRHFDGLNPEGEINNFAIAEIVINGKLEIVRFFNLYREIIVDLQIGNLNYRYNTLGKIEIITEPEKPEPPIVGTEVTVSLDKQIGCRSFKVGDEYVSVETDCGRWLISNFDLKVCVSKNSFGETKFSVKRERVTEEEFFNYLAEVGAVTFDDPEKPEPPDDNKILAESGLTEDEREFAKTQSENYIVAVIKDGKIYESFGDFTLARIILRGFLNRAPERPWAIKTIDGDIIIRGKGFADFGKLYFPETDGSEEDDDETIFAALPDVAELNDVSDEPKSYVEGSGREFTFTPPIEEPATIAAVAAAVAELNAAAPKGWGIFYDAEYRDFTVTFNDKIVTEIDSLAVAKILPPDKFFAQFTPLITRKHEHFIAQRNEEINALEEMRNELTGDEERLRIIDELIADNKAAAEAAFRDEMAQ